MKITGEEQSVRVPLERMDLPQPIQGFSDQT